MNFDEALSYLLSLGHETLTIKLGLRNTETLLTALADPHKEFPSVQIAGTNGKGSTAVTLDSICRAAGIRIGLFTSPHLISITERIKIAGKEVSETDFARLTLQVKRTAEELVKQGRLETLPTFFEHVTAIALLAFREAKVDLAILETGLGGRLDSTTAAGAEIVAITAIAKDHEEYLGHTLAEIAAEKAAIIRRGVTAIVAPQKEDALEVILDRCESVGVKPRYVERARYESISTGLRGRHQIENVSTAIALAEALRERGFTIKHEAIIRGVETVTHPGRLELWDSQPQILFDGAHNPAAALALRYYLEEFVKQPITMIFGAMRDKALSAMAAMLFPKADELILTELDNPRAATGEILLSAVPADFDKARVRVASSVKEAVQLAKKVTPEAGLICVTGSLYLVGAVQQVLNEPSGVAQGRLGH
ncbi:MAG TPA: folylpolyglutamate synthase/dihydrofolate synthase family protein [Pyrinomonadaceae bacterium]|nr:folylpolyglutamate synthase/dihydrofolate synthase family protein [Pyrinomonadaceae bacterium]